MSSIPKSQGYRAPSGERPPAPTTGSAAKPATVQHDAIEARLIEIREAIEKITRTLIDARRQVRNSQRVA